MSILKFSKKQWQAGEQPTKPVTFLFSFVQRVAEQTIVICAKDSVAVTEQSVVREVVG